MPRTDLHAYNVRQLRRFENEELDRRIKDVWGEIRESSGDKKAQIDKLKQSNAALQQEVEKLRLETKRHEKKVKDIQKEAEASNKMPGMQRVCSSCQKIKDESGQWKVCAEAEIS